MITIAREFGFDMGHCLPDHQGGCYRPHGHRYRLVVELDGELVGRGPEAGMVMDFQRVKDVVTREVIDRLDHRFVMARSDPRAKPAHLLFGGDSVKLVDWIPTAENLALNIGAWLVAAGLPVVGVVLWETPTCSATWREEH